ncbi:MAG: HPr kinase/phosphatase C-terminal domain-containing protein [Alphaproteobacteria bacterium]|nr:HPr kinase/phosphatase C-terminal domain-containing protein [Alphaproteobacteria bacterium]MBU1514928.1 HPr kinase/phosphatase C-terminal domain-containing protein [Alphaproteobacteria bacterium]MBU2094970.1 HPr kinase/phosphatase C-terminal domain-containing protein [Alphaproteobacteria bacterium]MBU2154057.1 HPr kinase/phosphatase C-terminal domain-containing protein [Alphaproteobacteria bacterium]MBU2305430.1 HPr kinase/phosphatase C-terminal domain-containing protein [Alphaproteobacteria
MILHAGLIARRKAGLWRGVMIEGPSGSGKSDLAFRALDQGFRLVADDRVLVWVSEGRLYGRAPDTLRGLIEVRGLDVITVEPLPLCEIGFMARLETPERMPEPTTKTILGIEIPLLAVNPFETSAPAKLSRAMEVFDAAHKRRI